MMNWFTLINVFFAIFSWKWATRSFNEGNNTAGWVNLFASALNAAAVASVIL